MGHISDCGASVLTLTFHRKEILLVLAEFTASWLVVYAVQAMAAESRHCEVPRYDGAFS